MKIEELPEGYLELALGMMAASVRSKILYDFRFGIIGTTEGEDSLLAKEARFHCRLKALIDDAIELAVAFAPPEQRNSIEIALTKQKAAISAISEYAEEQPNQNKI